MARTANMSVMGLYNWDQTIFANLQVPSGVDPAVVRDNIIMECAELEVLYPNPTVFKTLVGVWSLKEKPVWDKLYSTTQYEYNPIENYDRTEASTTQDNRTVSASGSDTVAGTSSLTHGGSDSWTAEVEREHGGQDTMSGTNTTTNSGTDTTTHSVAAYDASDLVQQSSDATTHGKGESVTSGQTNTYGQTVDQSESGSNTYGKTESGTSGQTTTYGKTDTTAGTQLVSSRIHGNIGVTTSQQMIQQEREIDTFNIYDIIIESFKARFCLLVY